MAPRSELQTLLEGIDDVDKVYFQPPPTHKMEYPCIVYQLDAMDSQHADNAPYRVGTRYQLTVIDRNPDSGIPKVIAKLPSVAFRTFYVVANMNHTVFTMYH